MRTFTTWGCHCGVRNSNLRVACRGCFISRHESEARKHEAAAGADDSLAAAQTLADAIAATFKRGNE
jgi:hypothetical protein